MCRYTFRRQKELQQNDFFATAPLLSLYHTPLYAKTLRQQGLQHHLQSLTHLYAQGTKVNPNKVLSRDAGHHKVTKICQYFLHL